MKEPAEWQEKHVDFLNNYEHKYQDLFWYLETTNKQVNERGKIRIPAAWSDTECVIECTVVFNYNWMAAAADRPTKNKI